MPESAAAQLLVVDYVFIGILALSSLFGLFRGLIREVLSLVSWVAAIWAAFAFGPTVAELIGDRIDMSSLRLAVGYLAVFIAVLIAGGIVGYLVSRALSATGLATTDRILGLVFGAVRALVVGILLVLLAQQTLVKDEPWWRDSLTVRQLTPIAEKVGVYLPEEWKAKVTEPVPNQPTPATPPQTTPQSNPAQPAPAKPAPAAPPSSPSITQA